MFKTTKRSHVDHLDGPYQKHRGTLVYGLREGGCDPVTPLDVPCLRLLDQILGA